MVYLRWVAGLRGKCDCGLWSVSLCRKSLTRTSRGWNSCRTSPTICTSLRSHWAVLDFSLTMCKIKGLPNSMASNTNPSGAGGVSGDNINLPCCCCSVAKLCPALCDPVDCSTPDLPVPHCVPEFAQVHVHWIDDAIQPSHPVLPLSPPALNLPQLQGPSLHSHFFQSFQIGAQICRNLDFWLCEALSRGPSPTCLDFWL